ncbi:MAG: hypothetical protein PUC90_01540 [Prevotella sp.]|nr:hypothetical protein [Prevotella sp.]
MPSRNGGRQSQIRTSLPHGLQPTNERRAESKLAYAMPSKEEEDN